MQEKYMALPPSAHLFLNVTEGRDQSISLISVIGSSGLYPLPDNDFTINKLLALGGSINLSFTTPQARLQRNNRTYRISGSDLLSDPPQNTVLVGGDRIFVEEAERSFISLSLARSQTVHPLATKRLTVLKASPNTGGMVESRVDALGNTLLRRLRQLLPQDC